ncbi:MAG: hypothetical protein RLP44_16850 [Aggregatilineales bacterium]
MQGASLIYFMIFSLIIVGMYITVRRRWVNPGVAAAVGIVAGTVAMMLTLSSMNSDMMDVQAIFFGFLIGTGFVVAALAVAWYFHSNELREHYMREEYAPVDYVEYDEHEDYISAEST